MENQIKATHWVISINPDLTGNIVAFGTYPGAWNYWRNMNLKPNGMMYMLIENPRVAEEFCNEHNLQFINEITQEHELESPTTME